MITSVGPSNSWLKDNIYQTLDLPVALSVARDRC